MGRFTVLPSTVSVGSFNAGLAFEVKLVFQDGFDYLNTVLICRFLHTNQSDIVTPGEAFLFVYVGLLLG